MDPAGAGECFAICRDRLYRRCRFLALPLGSLAPRPEAEFPGGAGTDLAVFAFDPAWFSDLFFRDPQEAERLLLHSACHCLLGHPLLPRGGEQGARQDLACDAAAELLARELAPELYESDATLDALRALLGDVPPGVGALLALLPQWEGDATALRRDSHSLWARAREAELQARATGGGDEGDSPARAWKRAAAALPRKGGHGDHALRSGMGSAARKQEVRLGAARPWVYGDYLRRFAEMREVPRTDWDQFDYGTYFLGLSLYGDVPLIEPLEYREERRLEELVIVIDTSQSCSHTLTQMFLERTRDLLEEQELFFRRFDLRILQCDCAVQRCDRITSLGELEHYMETLSITGLGGTDFRPAFRYVDALREQGELPRLKGLLYFTDGYGVFPEKPPDYEALFVFLEHSYGDIVLPPWGGILGLDAPAPKGSDHEYTAG